MAKFGHWCPELEAALTEPFPAEWVQQKKAGKGEGSRSISFVPWHRYVSRLNVLVGDGWQMGTPITVHVGEKLCMGIPLTIHGVTRINWGDEDDSEWEEVTNRATGEVEEKKTMYGSPVTNAFAQAFKRTCALFGMGLYLYEKGQPAPASAAQEVQRAQNAPRTAPDGFNLDTVAPGKKANGRTWRELLTTEDGRGFVRWAVENMGTLSTVGKDALRAALDAPVTQIVLLENELNKAIDLDVLTPDQITRIQKVIEKGDPDEVRISLDWTRTQVEKRRLGGGA